MSSSAETFKRYRRELLRLHNPVLSGDAVELVPVRVNVLRPEKRQGAAGSAFVTEREPSPISRIGGRGDAGDSPPGGAVTDFLWVSRPRDASTGEAPENSYPAAEVAEPDIRIEPPSFEFSLALFQDYSFAAAAPDAEKLELVWRDDRASAPQSVVMERQKKGSFKATIAIADGDYLYAYRVNESMRPDPGRGQRIVVLPDGVFSALHLSRQRVPCALSNYGTRDEVVFAESSADWLVTEKEIRLPAGQSVESAVEFLLREMSPGENLAVLHLNVKAEASEPMPVAAAHVSVDLTAGGAVPEFHYHPSQFDWIMQGKERVYLDVEVRAHGSGPLDGMISLSHSGEIINFHLVAGGADSRCFHRFNLDSANLPCRPQGTLNLTVLTDSYLFNYRLLRAQIPYRLIYLKKSLPALTFGKVRQGSGKSLRLEVERSDGKETDLSVSIPENASSYLHPYQARPNAYVFRIDAEALRPGTIIDEVITLTERHSGLQDQIRVLAEIVNSRSGQSEHAAAGL